MANLPLRIGTLRYDHVQALWDGTVRIDGVDADLDTVPLVSDMFEDMVRNQAYDVAELGLTFYLRTLELDDPPFVAIPVFPNRHFRHSSIYINTGSGIQRPEDLRGKVVGEFATYGHDAGIWPKGILSDDFGVTPDQCRWVVGGSDFPMEPFDWAPPIHPAGVDIRQVQDGRGLGPMLAAGEIDAFISALAPQAYLEGSPDVALLFPDVEAVERDYFRRTGIYPMMHTVVVRRDLLREHPGLARAVYEGFDASAERMRSAYRQGWAGQHVESSVPWFTQLYERNRDLFGDDFWPYGMSANRTAIDTYLRYFHEQGMSTRRWAVEEVFAEELLDT
jgi:4,5-dihydroxyphthalate decarboxylase